MVRVPLAMQWVDSGESANIPKYAMLLKGWQPGV